MASFIAAAALASIVGICLPVARADVYTWDAGGTDDDAFTGANWVGDVAPTNDGNAQVIFTDKFFTTGHASLTPKLASNLYVDSLTFAGGSSFTISSTNGRGLNIGSDGLTQSSTAAQTITVPTFLTDAQTWTLGNQTGALNFTGNGAINTQGYTLTVQAQGSGNILNGIITGKGGLTKTGFGTLTLTGASTYAGDTTVTAGTLAVGTGGGISGAGRFIVDASGSGLAAFNLGGTGSLSSAEARIGGSGSGTFNQSGGTFSTTASDLYLGNSAGSSGTYNLSGGNISTNNVYVGFSGSGTFAQTGGSLTLNSGNLYVGNNSNSNGVLIQSSGSVSVGQGDLYLGNYAGSSGTYNLSGGNISTKSAYIGYNGGGTFTQSGGSFTTNGNPLHLGYNSTGSGTYNLSGTGSTLSTGNIIVGESGSGTFNQTGGKLFPGGTLFLGYNSTGSGTYSLSGTGSTLSASAFIGYNGSGTFNQTGGSFTTGFQALYIGEGSTASGTYNLNGGTLTVPVVLGRTGTSTFHFNGGTLQAAVTIPMFFQGLTLADVQAGGARIDTAGNDVSTAQNFLHDATLGGSHDGGLTKTGAGTLTLSGSNTYTGPTAINAGILSLGSSGALGGGGVLSFGGGTLQFTAANTNDYSARFAATAGQAIQLDTNGQSVMLGTGFGGSGTSLTKLGTGTLTLAGTNTYTGDTTITGGTLSVTGSVTGGSINVGTGASLVITGSVGTNSNFAATLKVDGTVATPATVFLGGTGLLSTGTATVGSDGSGIFNQSGGAFTVNGTLTLGGATGTGTYNLEGGLLKVTSLTGGTGTSVFNFNGGTLQASGANSAFVHGIGTANVRGSNATVNSGVVIDTNGYNVTVAQALLHDTTSGAFAIDGGLTKLGAGALTLMGSNTYTGTTTVSAGTLQLANTLALQNSTLRLSSQAGSGVVSFANGVGPAFTLGGLSGDGNLALVNTAGGAVSLIVGNNNTGTTYSGVLSGVGSLTKTGDRTLILTGNNTYTGSTTINAGLLLAQNASGSATGTGAVTVANGGILGGGGTVSGAVTVQNGGLLAPGVQAVSALKLGGALTLQSGSMLTITLGGTVQGSGYDQVRAGGALTLAGSLNVRTVNGFTLAVGQTFTILDSTSDTALTLGTFSNAAGALYTDAAGETFSVNYAANADGGLVSNDVTLTYLGTNVVPEPAPRVLLAFSAVGLGIVMLRRSRQKVV